MQLWNTFHEADKVEKAFQMSLNNLGLDYIDLFLIHFPFGYAYKNDHEQWPRNSDGSRALNNVDYLETWKAMEKLVDTGLVKSIGISNFNSKQIERLVANARIKPVVNQVECSPTINQRKLTKFCKQRNIVVMGFCPLGHPNPHGKSPAFMYDERVEAIADKYNKTPAQIGLRYLVSLWVEFVMRKNVNIVYVCFLTIQVELGVVPIPKSVRRERLEQNINLFDFSLTEDDHKMMSNFNTNQRLVAMYDARKSPFWPYGIDF